MVSKVNLLIFFKDPNVVGKTAQLLQGMHMGVVNKALIPYKSPSRIAKNSAPSEISSSPFSFFL